MLLFHFCSCFLCSCFRLDLITHSCVPLTFWSVTLITDLHSMYVTHPFVICKLLATSPLCLSSASWLLYISDVKYKYSAHWGDCPSVQISSWILPANSPLSPLSPLPSGNSNLRQTSVSLSLSPPKYEDTGITRVQHIYWSQVLKPLRNLSTCHWQPFRHISAHIRVHQKNWFWHQAPLNAKFLSVRKTATEVYFMKLTWRKPLHGWG